jgi:hypothetical protein
MRLMRWHQEILYTGGVEMEKEYREYRTGQGVPKTGAYICQSGKKASIKKGENFPECPISGQDTYWKHENDE